MAVLQDLIVSVRNLRAELKVEQKLKVPIELYAHDRQTATLIEQNSVAIRQLAGVETITTVEESRARQAPTRGTARFDVRIVYEKKIDVAAECERLKKELDKIEKEMSGARQQLQKDGFVAHAPAEVVEGRRKRLAELELLQQRAKNKLEKLNC